MTSLSPLHHDSVGAGFDHQTDLERSHTSGIDEERFPCARDHSYLPGASHPLFPGDPRSIGSLSYHSSTEGFKGQSGTGNLIEMAVLDLPGIVLFPGATLPIRLHDRGWINYLGPEIDSSRSSPGLKAEVQFGVITKQEPVVSAMMQRRQSWTRRGYGPDRLRRLSERVVAELGDLADLSEEDEDAEGTPRIRAIDRVRYQPSSSLVSEHDLHSELSRQCRNENSPNGRIGTIATIVFTHGDSSIDRATSSIRRLHNEELAFTAVGTRRFRIVSSVRELPTRTSFYNQHVPRYIIEMLDDRPLTRPRFGVNLLPRKSVSLRRVERELVGLSRVSPIPEFVYKTTWPWKLVLDILETMEKSMSLAGLLDGLKATSGNIEGSQRHLTEPLQFSFYMASNLPIARDEKLALLELSTVERLRSILQIVARAECEDSMIHCKTCTTQVSQSSQMFSVGGAEGTIGAYVNEHGCVHQTITLRKVKEEEVWYTGDPQTKDSWFPGYSWTIMSCGFCGDHLGWKFVKVARTEPKNLSRPDCFYGLSTANIKTLHRPVGS